MNGYWQLAGTIVAQLLIGVFIYGQLTQRVKDQGGWLKQHQAELDDHAKQLNNHQQRISNVEGRLKSAGEE